MTAAPGWRVGAPYLQHCWRGARMDSSSRECVPKLGGRSPMMGIRSHSSEPNAEFVLARPAVSFHPFAGIASPHPNFTHGHCPDGAGKCRFQISRRSHSGAGPCCLQRGNKLDIRWWAGRREWRHAAPSCCKTGTQRPGKGLRAPLSCLVAVATGETQSPQGLQAPLRPDSPTKGQQRQVEQK